MKRILLIAENKLWAQSVIAFSRVVSSRLYFSDRTNTFDGVLINTGSMSDKAITNLVDLYSGTHVFLMGHEKQKTLYKDFVFGFFAEDTGLRHIISAMSMALSPIRRELEKGGNLFSSKEKLVLRLLTEGYSDREISKKSSLPLSSVKYYLRNAYDKLGVKNRVQAALKLRDMSL